MSNQKSPSNKEKRHKIRRLLTVSPELSDRQIAKLAGGVSHNTVSAVRDEMVKKGEFDQLGTLDKNAWQQHPLITSGKVDLDKLSIEGLCAIKAPGVLDTMMQNNWKSP